MTIKGYSIKRAAGHEVDLVISWANSEGWNPGIHDAETFYTTDSNGFFVGVLDDKPIASISAVAYGSSFGFLGFYIVLPTFRGRGFGTEIWNAGMKYLEGRNIGLDSVLEQQKLYERKGFSPCYRSVRHRGVGTGYESRSEGIKYLSEMPMEDLLAYDDQYFPVPRHVFTKSWIRQPGGVAFGVMNDSGLEGYGVLRQCHQGYKIGPLFADDYEVADCLFCALCGRAPQGVPVFLDTPEPNSLAMDLAKRHHMYPVFETVRMYTGKDPGLPMDRIYGVTSFELG
ncbi:MAG: GNAT family N-acetyltransferase [Methanothrix sp.]